MAAGLAARAARPLLPSPSRAVWRRRRNPDEGARRPAALSRAAATRAGAREGVLMGATSGRNASAIAEIHTRPRFFSVGPPLAFPTSLSDCLACEV